MFAIRFFNLPPRLATEATDFPWVTITVTTEKETKSVSTDYYLPLWEIAALVDILNGEIRVEKSRRITSNYQVITAYTDFR